MYNISYFLIIVFKVIFYLYLFSLLYEGETSHKTTVSAPYFHHCGWIHALEIAAETVLYRDERYRQDTISWFPAHWSAGLLSQKWSDALPFSFANCYDVSQVFWQEMFSIGLKEEVCRMGGAYAGSNAVCSAFQCFLFDD